MFPTLVSNLGLLRRRFERFASRKEFLPGLSHKRGFFIDTVNGVWHLFNSLDRSLSHVFGTSLGLRANPAILLPAMIQRLPVVHFRRLDRVGLTLVRVERHHLLNHTPRFNPMILQLHTSGR